MKALRLAAVVALAGVCMFAVRAAGASTAPTGSDPLLECAQHQAQLGNFGGCTRDASGRVSPSSTPGSGGAGAGFGGFVAFAIFWSLIPFGIAVALASSRGEGIGSAVLLTLFLGWIGLAIVYFGQRRTLAAATATLDRLASPTPSPQRPATTPRRPESSGVRARLVELDQLRADGLVNQSEYETRRQAILADL